MVAGGSMRIYHTQKYSWNLCEHEHHSKFIVLLNLFLTCKMCMVLWCTFLISAWYKLRTCSREVPWIFLCVVVRHSCKRPGFRLFKQPITKPPLWNYPQRPGDRLFPQPIKILKVLLSTGRLKPANTKPQLKTLFQLSHRDLWHWGYQSQKYFNPLHIPINSWDQSKIKVHKKQNAHILSIDEKTRTRVRMISN